jgi:hypothetical protein
MSEDLNAYIDTYFFNIDASLIRTVKQNPSTVGWRNPRLDLQSSDTLAHLNSLILLSFVLTCPYWGIDGGVMVCAGAAIVIVGRYQRRSSSAADRAETREKE